MPSKSSRQDLKQLVQEAVREAFSQKLTPGEKLMKFSLAHLKRLRNPELVLRYVEATKLPVLNRGSARTVYALSDDAVLKIITGEAYWQNTDEIKAYQCAGPTPSFLTKIIAHAPNGAWIVAERARELNSTQFEQEILSRMRVTGNDFLWSVVAGLRAKYFPDGSQQNHQELYESNSWYRQFFDFVKNCNMHPFELTHQNFGLTKDGRLVFLDYGRENEGPF